jgi:nucleotide-binding universal stress UspA family protein
LFEKILVPLDGSEHSLEALENGAEIAKKFSGKITLIHVYSVQPIMMQDPSTAGSPSIPIFTGAEVSTKVGKLLVEGHTVEEIVRAANEGFYGLIVIGARGVSHMREMLLGSVTDGVIHHVHCPVLVVK